MKNLLITCIVIIFFNVFAFSQNNAHTNGGEFTKTIEFNRICCDSNNYYNLNSKGDTEKQFFGDMNAPVEFFFNPPFPTNGNDFPDILCGCRIMKNSVDNSYVLEIKRILSGKLESLSFPISNQFAEKLYKKTTFFIDNFKAVGGPVQITEEGGILMRIITDGVRVTFRTVVDEEVWTLKIRIPSGNARNMSDLFMQIIKESYKNKTIDEVTYTKMLDDV